MQYKNEYELARLISRRQLGILSPDEELQLEEWLQASDANRELYDRITESDGFQMRKDFDATVYISAVNQQIHNKIRHSLMQKWMLRTASVAAVILCGVMITVLWNRGDQTATNQIAETSENIELILSDGQKLTLNELSSGQNNLPEGFEVVNEENQNEKLVYSEKNKVSQSGSHFITLNVPRKQTYQLELPDGTIVCLNSCSSLRFPEQFKSGSRDVFLSGEAAFAVKKDKKSPFYVHTDCRDIMVTGTRFNVSAYEDDKSWQTTLIEGGIELIGEQQNIVMKPLHQYAVNKQSGVGQLKTVTAAEAVFAPWMSGVLTFEATPFEDIVQKLQRWYDIQFSYRDDRIKKLRFTATVDKQEQLDVFLTLIEQTTNIKFIVEGNNITVDIKH